MTHERPMDIALKVVDHVDALLGYWDRDSAADSPTLPIKPGLAGIAAIF